MSINYKPLWKLLIDRDMKKGDLMRKASISSSTMAKLAKNDTVRTDVLDRICCTLECNIEDIMMICSDESPKE